MWTTPTLLLSCSFHAPALLLPYSSPAVASAPAPAVLLPFSFQAPIRHIPSSSTVVTIVLRCCRKYCQFPVLPSSAEIRPGMIYFGIIRHSVCVSVCLWYEVAQHNLGWNRKEGSSRRERQRVRKRKTHHIRSSSRKNHEARQENLRQKTKIEGQRLQGERLQLRRGELKISGKQLFYPFLLFILFISV